MFTKFKSPRSRQQRGFSLIELVMAIVIFNVAITGLLSTYSFLVQNSADPMVRLQSMSIANSYLEEIMLTPFLDPTSSNFCNTGTMTTDRANFDDICDYNGLNDDGAKNQFGQHVSTLASYSINVSVQTDTIASIPAGDWARIDVTVTDPQGTQTIVSGFKANY